MANLVTGIREQAVDAAIDEAKDLLRQVMGEKSPERKETEAAIADQAETRVETSRVPAGAAGRTIPSDLRDSRYRALGPAGAHRNADDDVLAQRYFIALKNHDQMTLREIAADDNHKRASLAIGDPGANFGVSDGTGAQLLPLPLANYLQVVIYRNARMRNWARKFDAGSGDSLRIPIQNAKSTVAYFAESATISEGTPTVSDGVKLTLQKLAGRGDITDEMMASSAFNVGSWLQVDVGENMAEFEDLTMYQDGAGSGSNEPIGLEASDTTTATTPPYYVAVAPGQTGANDFLDPGTLTLAHLNTMYYALPERHRRNAIWTGPDSLGLILSGLVDDQGRPILNLQNNEAQIVGDSDAAGQVGTIFGRPFVNMPGLEGVGEDSNRLYFIRMDRSYAMLERGQITAKASEHVSFLSDTTVFKFTRMADGQPIGNRTAGLPFDYVYSGNLL